MVIQHPTSSNYPSRQGLVLVWRSLLRTRCSSKTHFWATPYKVTPRNLTWHLRATSVFEVGSLETYFVINKDNVYSSLGEASFLNNGYGTNTVGAGAVLTFSRCNARCFFVKPLTVKRGCHIFNPCHGAVGIFGYFIFQTQIFYYFLFFCDFYRFFRSRKVFII